jgi:hypothetical protein
MNAGFCHWSFLIVDKMIMNMTVISHTRFSTIEFTRFSGINPSAGV